MPVTLTSPAMGLDVGATYTGPEEDFLLSDGKARRDGYTGPGVSNTGPSHVTSPDLDPRNESNREPAPARTPEGGVDPGPRDPAMGYTDEDDPAYDFDPGGVDDEVVTP